MYRVIKMFTDLQDGGYMYNAGDEFPRSGVKVSESRINELLSTRNRQGKPLIALEEKPPEIEDLSLAEVQEEPEEPEKKPARRTKKGK